MSSGFKQRTVFLTRPNEPRYRPPFTCLCTWPLVDQGCQLFSALNAKPTPFYCQMASKNAKNSSSRIVHF